MYRSGEAANCCPLNSQCFEQRRRARSASSIATGGTSASIHESGESGPEARAKPAPPVRKALGKLDVNGTMPTVSHPKGGLKPGAAINVNLHQDKDAEAKGGKRKLLNPLGKAFA